MPAAAYGRRSLPINQTGPVDLQQNAEELLKQFSTRWSVQEHQRRPQEFKATSDILWSDSNWYLTVRQELMIDLEPRSLPGHQKRSTSLRALISSQHLRHRLQTTFGIRTRQPYDETICLVLRNRDVSTCSLYIQDSPDYSLVEYRGERRVGKEAMQLFEWITGHNFPSSSCIATAVTLAG